MSIAALMAGVLAVRAADDAATLQEQVNLLKEQNRQLQEQVATQAGLLRNLEKRLEEVEAKGPAADAATAAEIPPNREANGLFSSGRLQFSGSASVGIFHTGRQGAYRNSEFRADEARLNLDAKIVDDVYFFTELNLRTRETDQESLQLGELYVDFENVSRFVGIDGAANLRVGRFDIPFGEEYLSRDAIDNPLISRSLADIWGIDEGVELFGSVERFSYVLAVQNGGHPLLHDYNSDKAIIARIAYDPTSWMRASVSAMRTGDLAVRGDELSEVWFGGGFIRNLSPAATEFSGEMLEGDLQFTLPRGHLKFFGGVLQTDDNDPRIDNQRDIYFHSSEGLLDLTDKFYSVARFSEIYADGGAPLTGFGSMGRYFFNNANLTDHLWRLSFGLGYRLRKNLVIKAEYSVEEGRLLNGEKRATDFLGAEVAVGF